MYSLIDRIFTRNILIMNAPVAASWTDSSSASPLDSVK